MGRNTKLKLAWGYGFATNVGSLHEDGKGQDYCLCTELPEADGDFALVAVVSDGAGSSSAADVGSRTACEAFIASWENVLRRKKNLAEVENEEIKEIFSQVVWAIKTRAASDEQPIENYACTLVGAVLGSDMAIFMQVGDGACVYRADEDYKVALWPEQSEFVNTTFFLTSSDVEKHTFYVRATKPIEEIVLFTDGLQYLILDFKNKTAHQPFFNSVTEKLQTGTSGHDETFSDWLKTVLQSKHVTGRSDDDTSIVVARRM